MDTNKAFLLAVYLFSLCTVVVCFKCADKEWEAAAEDAINGFRYDVQRQWHKFSKQRLLEDPWEATDEEMNAVLPRGGKVQCLLGFEVVPPHHTLELKRKLFSSRACTAPAFKDRAQVTKLVLAWVLQSYNGLKIEGFFRFWVDLVDTSAGPDSLYQQLSYPVLSYGRSPDKHFTLPIPELHLMFAIIRHNGDLYDDYMELTHAAQNKPFMEEMYYLFTYNYTMIDWSRKKQQVLFRGACNPTMHPTPFESKENYISLRPQLCKTLSKLPSFNQLYDIGMTIPPALTCGKEQRGFNGDICRDCKPCATTEQMTRDEMRKYRYHLAIDGYGPTFDALYWKLASGSIVFQLWETEEQPYFVQWFSPLLRPSQHYIPTTFGNLDERVVWCLIEERLCRQIAENSRHVMRCRVTVGSATHYLGKALQMVHDIQVAPSFTV